MRRKVFDKWQIISHLHQRAHMLTCLIITSFRHSSYHGYNVYIFIFRLSKENPPTSLSCTNNFDISWSHFTRTILLKTWNIKFFPFFFHFLICFDERSCAKKFLSFRHHVHDQTDRLNALPFSHCLDLSPKWFPQMLIQTSFFECL